MARQSRCGATWNGPAPRSRGSRPPTRPHTVNCSTIGSRWRRSSTRSARTLPASAEIEAQMRAGSLGDRMVEIWRAKAIDVIKERFQDEHVRAFFAWVAFMTLHPLDEPETGLLAFSLVAGRQRFSWILPRGRLDPASAGAAEDHRGERRRDPDLQARDADRRGTRPCRRSRNCRRHRVPSGPRRRVDDPHQATARRSSARITCLATIAPGSPAGSRTSRCS